MKYLSLILVCFLLSCTSNSQEDHSKTRKTQENDTLYRFSNEEFEIGVPAGFKNSSGKVIIPIGKYSHVWTDKFVHFAIVSDKKNTGDKIVAIDKKGKVLFEVYWFDNGPDYIVEGLFRVKQNGKIGFANEKGEIVIPCKYACAFPFENGEAKVAMECKEVKDGEHTVCESENWIYINKKGNETRK